MTSTHSSGDVRLGVETLSQGSSVRIVIRGEADAGNLGRLEVALRTVTLDADAVVQIDLSELDFIDVPALRLLTTFAGQVRREGHPVETLGAPALVRRTVRILEAQDQLGLA